MPETTGICSPAHAPANTILIFATHFSIVPRSASLSSLGTRPCPVIFPQLGLATRVLSCVNVSIGQRLGADKCQLRWSSLFQSHDRTAETRFFTVLTSPICVTSLHQSRRHLLLGECQDELQLTKQIPRNSLQSRFRLHFRLRDVLACSARIKRKIGRCASSS